MRKYIKAHDGMLLANHGALTVGGDLFTALLQDGDDRALREDQPGRAPARAARTCYRREEVLRLQELARHLRHQGASDLRRYGATDAAQRSVRRAGRAGAAEGGGSARSCATS